MHKTFSFLAVKNSAVYIAAGLVLGLAFCFYASTAAKLYFAAILAFLFILSIILLPKGKKAACIIFASAVFACGYSICYTGFYKTPLLLAEGSQVLVEGKITDYTKTDSTLITVEGEIGGVKGKVAVFATNFRGSYGDKVKFMAEISKIEDLPFFPAVAYNNAKGFFVNATPTGKIEITEKCGIDPIMHLRKFNDEMSDKIQMLATGDAGGMLTAMTCGTELEVSSELDTALGRTGIAHVLSVSGLHVSLLVLLINKFLGLLKLGKVPIFIISEAFMVIYVLFCGARVSALRALLMMTLYLISQVAKRRYNALNSIAVCVIIMMLENPYAIADSSLLLSLSGIFGVSVVAPKILSAFRIRNKIVKACLSTASAFVCTLPVCAFCFPEISLVSVITNLILVTPCEIALVFCLIFVASGGAAALGFLVEWAAEIMRIIIKICEWAASFEFTYITVKSKSLAVAILATALLVACCYLVSKRVKPAFILCAVLSCGIFSGYAYYNYKNAQTAYLRFICEDENYICAVFNANRCFIIDSSGSLSFYANEIVNNYGIKQVDAVAVLEHGPSGYASYLPLNPEKIIVPEPAPIYNGPVDCIEYPHGFEAKLPYVSASYNGETVKICFNGTGLELGLINSELGNSISVFDKYIVITSDNKARIIANKNDICLRVSNGKLEIYPWLR